MCICVRVCKVGLGRPLGRAYVGAGAGARATHASAQCPTHGRPIRIHALVTLVASELRKAQVVRTWRRRRVALRRGLHLCTGTDRTNRGTHPHIGQIPQLFLRHTLWDSSWDSSSVTPSSFISSPWSSSSATSFTFTS